MSRHHRGPLIPAGKALVQQQLKQQEILGFLFAAEQLHVHQGQLAAAIRGYHHVMHAIGEKFLATKAGRRACYMAALAAYQLRFYGDAEMLMTLVRDGYGGVGGEPKAPEVHYNLGLILHASRKVEEAAESYRRAIAFKGFDFPAAENNLGNALRELGDQEGAEACFARIIASDPADPVARYNLSHVLLLRGYLERGFTLYESRWQMDAWRAEYGRPDLQSLRLPDVTVVQRHLDDGTRQAGVVIAGEERWSPRLLVHQEQGVGDSLQFLRYLPRLVAMGFDVTFEAPRELGPWLSSLTVHGLRVISRGDEIPAHDVHVPLLSLPAWFRLKTEADIPPVWELPVRKQNPLHTDIRDTRQIIGVVWAGNARHHSDHHRSAPITQLAELFTRPNTRFVSLQHGARGVELLTALPTLRLGSGSTIEDVSAYLTDFEATAAIVRDCDAIVTVDTSVAHLAGTLGVPTFVLTNWLSEWRWQLDRTDSPWYPSVTLVRQPTLGDWPAAAAQTLTLLEAL